MKKIVDRGRMDAINIGMNNGEQRMTDKEIIEVLDKEVSSRSDVETKRVRRAMGRKANGLTKEAYRLLSILGEDGEGAIRIVGTTEFKIPKVSRTGGKLVYTFDNSELKELLRAGLVTVVGLVEGIAKIDRTRLGKVALIHRY